MPHDSHFDGIDMDTEDNDITFEDYYNHLAGFDENNYKLDHWVETGNFHMNMIVNAMSMMPGGGPMDPPHKDQSQGQGSPVMPY